MLRAYPQIFTLGDRHIQDIFLNDVEITEKADGSQFVFGKLDGEIHMRSKRSTIYANNPQKMFQLAVDRVCNMQLPDDMIFYCEYLEKPKHNVLNYGRVPKNNLMLFGVSNKVGKFINEWQYLAAFAEILDIELAPLLFQGRISSAESLMELLERDSIFGNVKIEGYVCKNYDREMWLGGLLIPLTAGKFVSEEFKEKHKTDWKGDNTGKGRWDIFKESYRTEARWQKAVIHLKEQGLLEDSPKDIGILIKEVQRDIEEEEKENIKTFLWSEFGKELLRQASHGLPDFYKEQIMKLSFGGNDGH